MLFPACQIEFAITILFESEEEFFCHVFSISVSKLGIKPTDKYLKPGILALSLLKP